MKNNYKIVIGVGVFLLLIVLLVQPLFFGLLFISYNFTFFVDNFFNFSNKIHPIICWGIVFSFLGLIIGFFVSVKRFNLNPRFKLYCILGLLFLVFLVSVASKPFDYESSKKFHDEHNWKLANQINTLTSYEKYLKEFPQGKFAIEATVGMEARFWDSAITYQANPSIFQHYLEKFPTGIHVLQANLLYEDSFWAQVEASKTIDNLNNYIRAYPNGKYTAIAKSQLWGIKHKRPDLSIAGQTSSSTESTNSQKTITYPNGDKYIGHVRDGDKKEGKGKFYYADGRIYQGPFKNNQFEGKGTLLFTDGSKLMGTWVNGSRNGDFILYNTDNTKEYQTYQSGKRIK